MTVRRRWLIAGAGAALLLIFIATAHPFFAITRTTGSRVLVVEGWLNEQAIAEAARLMREKGYERAFTTGVARPAAYYLKGGDRLRCVPQRSMKGVVKVKAAGLPGTPLVALADDDTLFLVRLEGDPRVYTATIHTPCSTFTLLAPDRSGDPELDRVFIGGWAVDGEDLQARPGKIQVIRADGRSQPQAATFAHQAAILLEKHGVPAGRITTVPTGRTDEGRTWTSARDMVAIAKAQGIRSFDVATLGVHARRTRGLYRRAAAGGLEVGVIALPDRWCEPEDWWLHWYGWVIVLKEVVGAHQPYTAG